MPSGKRSKALRRMAREMVDALPPERREKLDEQLETINRISRKANDARNEDVRGALAERSRGKKVRRIRRGVPITASIYRRAERRLRDLWKKEKNKSGRR